MITKFAKLAILMAAGAAAIEAGRANIVVHYSRDGAEKEIWASAGSCRHHLSDHAGDFVRTPGGGSSDPDDCN